MVRRIIVRGRRVCGKEIASGESYASEISLRLDIKIRGPPKRHPQI